LYYHWWQHRSHWLAPPPIKKGRFHVQQITQWQWSLNFIPIVYTSTMDENLVWFDFLRFFCLISCTHQLEKHAFIAYPKLTQILWSYDFSWTQTHTSNLLKIGSQGGSHDECPNALKTSSWGHARWSSNK